MAECEHHVDIRMELLKDILKLMRVELKNKNYHQVQVHQYFLMCKSDIKRIKELQKERKKLKKLYITKF